ncbi:response regulator [Gracilimonas sp.]|uniref:response regulator n=1 Tax=Gracilimonas sp. TaxID=1974203 RepID=UPI003BAAC8A5
MKKKKSALIITDDIVLLQEMKRMLAELEIKHVFEAYDSKSGLDQVKKHQPVFTFLDLDIESDSAEHILARLESNSSTHLILLRKKQTSPSGKKATSEYPTLEKPVTLNRLNDIVHPNLSFAALLMEANELIREESSETMFRL